MTMRSAIHNVWEWNRRFGHIPEHPSVRAGLWKDSEKHRELALKLIEEEVTELREAVEAQDEVEILDAICDILVTVFGLAAKADLSDVIQDGFNEVMRSNWSKLDADGNPVYYENGKIGKSDQYTPPDLRKVIDDFRDVYGRRLEIANGDL